LKLAALFSGGKDSTYSIYKIMQMGHDVMCLITINPVSEESHLLHHPNIQSTIVQAQSMKMPQIMVRVDSDNTSEETSAIKSALSDAKSRYGIEGMVHGGILSQFQKGQFEGVANDLGLQVLAPIWKQDQKQYMETLLDSGFEFIITAVSCDGLDESWLGRKITKNDLATLQTLSTKYQFNLSFEGGEAETFVTNCPLFAWPIKITKSKKIWDGYRGRFEILQSEIEK
jgi:diphthine-ammonia ligase